MPKTPSKLRTVGKALGLASALILVSAVIAAQLGACHGSRPAELGFHSGRFKPCPKTPNCVSSTGEPADREHYIAPMARRTAEPKTAVAVLRDVVRAMPRTEVIESGDDYLYVEFTSWLWRFVDDVEFAVPADGDVIHVRSASRLGKSDLGVNRERIEEIRRAYREAIRAPN